MDTGETNNGSDKVSGMGDEVRAMLQTDEFADMRAILDRADVSREAVEMFLFGVALTMKQYVAVTDGERAQRTSPARPRASMCRHRGCPSA